MTEQEIKELIERQRAYFATGATLSRQSRLKALDALRRAMETHEEELYDALHADLGKSRTESYMCELGLTYSEITWMKRHLRRLMREKWVYTPLAHFAAHSYRSPQPYGTVLVVSPWNYPVLLTLEPLVDALAAGNTVILKPSAYSPQTTAVLARIIADAFPPGHVAVVTGGRAENQALFHQRFDLIFFTGGVNVGREVMRNAAEHLTPVVLELGGKSPVIVDESADIDVAAARVVFGKYLNCGQTCVAPDYVLCHSRVHDRFVEAVKREIVRMFGQRPLDNPDYGKIINRKHFDRLTGLIDPAKVVFGGATDPEGLRIEPVVMDSVTPDDPVMQQEIFGPLMPVLTYDSLDQAIAFVQERPHPLALYLFTSKKRVKREVKAKCHFGGGCVNDTVIHLATSEMPFGGVGHSGMGCYHGRDGFNAFTHRRSIVDKYTWLDLPIRYQPYTPLKARLLKLFLH